MHLFRPAFVALLLASLQVAAPAQAPAAHSLDAETILGDTADKYGQAKDFYFIASEQTTTEAGDQKRDTFTTIVTARDHAGRFRVEFDDRVNSSSLVSNGVDAWAYMPLLQKYSKLPEGKVTFGAAGSAPDFAAMTSRFIDRYRSVTSRLLQASVEGDETVETQDGSIACQRVKAVYNPPQGMRDGHIERTYWISKDSGLILREHSVASMLQPNSTQHVIVTQEISFQTAKADEPLDEALFVFTPPPGAKRVESFRDGAAADLGKVDAEAPDFTLERIVGDSVQLSQLRGKVVLLDFWATWCAPCRYDMPHVQALYEELGERGLAVFGVSSEPRERAQAYLDQNGFTFPSLIDGGMRAAALYQIHAIPTFIVVDRRGRIAAYMQGTRTREELRKAVLAAGL